MKLLLLPYATALTLLVACQSIDIPDEESPTIGKTQKVSIFTRTTNAEPPSYPIAVYAFDAQGNCSAQQSIASAKEELNLNLKAGNYRIVAVSGGQAYQLPNGKANSTAPLTMPTATNTNTLPLMRGEASVNVGNTKTRVSLTLNYSVAKVDIALNNLPESVQDVKVRFEHNFSQQNLAGAYSQPQTSIVSAARQSDGTWKTATTYMFPAAQPTTSLTLVLTDAQQSLHYAAQLASPLKAGIPLQLQGNYTETNGTAEFTLGGEVIAGGWAKSVSEQFNFGPGGEQPKPAPNEPNPAPNQPTTAIPAAGELWKGQHIVAFVDNATNNSADLLLISKSNWDNLPSANSEESPEEALEIEQQYSEGDLTGWTMPSQEDAKRLSKTYFGENLAKLNATINSVQGEDIWVELDNTKVRYLCEKGRKTYSYRGDGSVLNAGKSVKTYHMRLVKKVHITVGQ